MMTVLRKPVNNNNNQTFSLTQTSTIDAKHVPNFHTKFEKLRKSG